MIDKKQAVKIAKSFIKDILYHESWYQTVRPLIKATLLYGSVAKDTDKAGSDIDILVILPLEAEKKHTVGEYFYDYQGHKINIDLRSIERLRKIAEAHNDLNQKEVFRDSILVNQTDDEVNNLLQKIATI